MRYPPLIAACLLTILAAGLCSPAVLSAKRSDKQPARRAVATQPTNEKPAQRAVATQPTNEKPARRAVATQPTNEKPARRAVATQPTNEKPARRAAATQPTNEKPARRAVATQPTNEKPAQRAVAARAFQLVYLRGRVVFLSAALKQKYGIKQVPESKERVLALQTADGMLLPLVEDLRGRSFRRDKRLREMEVVLMVRRYEGLPMLQVIRVYRIQQERTFEVDYWCEICAIAMYELKACDCCQGEIELRQRLRPLPAGALR